MEAFTLIAHMPITTKYKLNCLYVMLTMVTFVCVLFQLEVIQVSTWNAFQQILIYGLAVLKLLHGSSSSVFFLNCLEIGTQSHQYAKETQHKKH